MGRILKKGREERGKGGMGEWEGGKGRNANPSFSLPVSFLMKIRCIVADPPTPETGKEKNKKRIRKKQNQKSKKIDF